MDKISRYDAQLAGMTFYFTGTPCEQGHVARRYVSNRMCRECLAVRRDPDAPRRMEMRPGIVVLRNLSVPIADVQSLLQIVDAMCVARGLAPGQPPLVSEPLLFQREMQRPLNGPPPL